MIILPWWCDVSDTGNADIRMSVMVCCQYQQYDTRKILPVCSTCQHHHIDRPVLPPSWSYMGDNYTTNWTVTLGGQYCGTRRRAYI